MKTDSRLVATATLSGHRPKGRRVGEVLQSPGGDTVPHGPRDQRLKAMLKAAISWCGPNAIRCADDCGRLAFDCRRGRGPRSSPRPRIRRCGDNILDASVGAAEMTSRAAGPRCTFPGCAYQHYP
jgi:hypothetical protein